MRHWSLVNLQCTVVDVDSTGWERRGLLRQLRSTVANYQQTYRPQKLRLLLPCWGRRMSEETNQTMRYCSQYVHKTLYLYEKRRHVQMLTVTACGQHADCRHNHMEKLYVLLQPTENGRFTHCWNCSDEGEVQSYQDIIHLATNPEEKNAKEVASKFCWVQLQFPRTSLVAIPTGKKHFRLKRKKYSSGSDVFFWGMETLFETRLSWKWSFRRFKWTHQSVGVLSQERHALDNDNSCMVTAISRWRECCLLIDILSVHIEMTIFLPPAFYIRPNQCQHMYTSCQPLLGT